MTLHQSASALFSEDVREIPPLCSPEVYEAALVKLRERWEDFEAAGWTVADLVSCALKPYGHHGLAMALRPGRDIGRIWTWCCEVLASVAGNGERSRLVHWRGAPQVELMARFGACVIPPELAREWREAKL